MKQHATPIALITLLLGLSIAACGEPTPQERMMQSMQDSIAGDQAGALAEISAAIDANPRAAELYIVRAGVHESLGDLASSLADYETALRYKPGMEPGLKEQMDSMRKQLGASPSAAQTKALSAPAKVVVAGQLQLENLTFCSTRPTGYRDYMARPGATYKPGEKAWIYFDVKDLTYQGLPGGDQQNEYTERMSLNAPSGAQLMDKVIIDDRRIVAVGDEADQMFLRNQIPIPADAPDGAYAVQITFTDKLSMATAQTSVSFNVSR